MDSDPALWSKRPLPQDVLKAAAQDLTSLLALADKQNEQLAQATRSLNLHLSLSSCQASWLEADCPR